MNDLFNYCISFMASIPPKQFYTGHMFLSLSMQLRNHANTQPVKRFKRFFSSLLTISMDVGRIFSRGGAVGDFPKFFPGGAKVVKFLFTPRNSKDNLFLLIISKSRGGGLPPLPTPMTTSYIAYAEELL